MFGFSINGVAIETLPCKKDVEVLCHGIAPGEGRIGTCLKENKLKVSHDCEIYALKLRDQRKVLKAACYGDIREVCKGIVPGNSRVMNCLKDNKASISALCKQGIESLSESEQK